MQYIFAIASNVSTPLALGGFFAAIVFWVFRQIVAKNIFPKLNAAIGADILKLIIERLFVLALIAMILGFVAYLVVKLVPQPVSPVVLTTPAPKACRDRTHGVERYQRVFPVARDSNWMGGGFNQSAWCSQVIAELRGQHPDGSFRVMAQSEDSHTTCAPLNCPQYQYHCTVEVSTDPLFVERISSACK